MKSVLKISVLAVITMIALPNCDIFEVFKSDVTLTGKVVCYDGEPVASVVVAVESEEQSVRKTATTNKKGEWSANVPENTPVTVSVTANGGFDSKEVPGYTAGKKRTVPDLHLPCGDDEGGGFADDGNMTLEGRVVDCNNEPVANQPVYVYNEKKVEIAVTYTDFDGYYSVEVPAKTILQLVTSANGGSDLVNIPGYPKDTRETVIDLKVPCDEDDETPRPYTLKEGAAKYVKNDYIQAITVKDYGLKERYDVFYCNEEARTCLNTLILNHANKTSIIGFGSSSYWDVLTYDKNSRLNRDFVIDENAYEWALTGSMTVAGKTCKKYEYSTDGKKYVVASLNGLILYMEANGVEQFKAAVATDSVPDSAFGKTWDISWLE